MKGSNNWTNYTPRILRDKSVIFPISQVDAIKGHWAFLDEQIPEEAPKGVECGKRDWREGHMKYAWKYLVPIREMGRYPTEGFQRAHNASLERPSMWVPGTPGHHDKIIPPNPYPCLLLLSFFPSPHPTPEAAVAAPGLEMEWQGQDEQWNSMLVSLPHSGAYATNQAWARRNEQVFDWLWHESSSVY